MGHSRSTETSLPSTPITSCPPPSPLTTLNSMAGSSESTPGSQRSSSPPQSTRQKTAEKQQQQQLQRPEKDEGMSPPRREKDVRNKAGEEIEQNLRKAMSKVFWGQAMKGKKIERVVGMEGSPELAEALLDKAAYSDPHAASSSRLQAVSGSLPLAPAVGHSAAAAKCLAEREMEELGGKASAIAAAASGREVESSASGHLSLRMDCGHETGRPSTAGPEVVKAEKSRPPAAPGKGKKQHQQQQHTHHLRQLSEMCKSVSLRKAKSPTREPRAADNLRTTKAAASAAAGDVSCSLGEELCPDASSSFGLVRTSSCPLDSPAPENVGASAREGGNGSESPRASSEPSSPQRAARPIASWVGARVGAKVHESLALLLSLSTILLPVSLALAVLFPPTYLLESSFACRIALGVPCLSLGSLALIFLQLRQPESATEVEAREDEASEGQVMDFGSSRQEQSMPRECSEGFEEKRKKVNGLLRRRESGVSRGWKRSSSPSKTSLNRLEQQQEQEQQPNLEGTGQLESGASGRMAKASDAVRPKDFAQLTREMKLKSCRFGDTCKAKLVPGLGLSGSTAEKGRGQKQSSASLPRQDPITGLELSPENVFKFPFAPPSSMVAAESSTASGSLSAGEGGVQASMSPLQGLKPFLQVIGYGQQNQGEEEGALWRRIAATFPALRSQVDLNTLQRIGEVAAAAMLAALGLTLLFGNSVVQLAWLSMGLMCVAGVARRVQQRCQRGQSLVMWKCLSPVLKFFESLGRHVARL